MCHFLSFVEGWDVCMEADDLSGDGTRLTLHMPIFYCAVSLVDLSGLFLQIYYYRDLSVSSEKYEKCKNRI